MAKIRKQETLDYTALKRELKSKGPENLYMLWGPEDYLIADFVSSLRDICVSGEMRDFDAKRLNGPLPDARDVEDALNAMPFFGGRTFVELSGFDVNRCKDDKLPALLSDIPEWCTVVITLPAGVSPDGRLSLVKQIKKSGKAVEFTAQERPMLFRWIQRRFESAGKTVDRPAMERLVFLSGELMNRLIPEIEKICAYSKEARVTVADVDAVAHHIPEASAFEMTDRISLGDYDGAAGYLAELLAGDAEFAEILGAVGWQMRRLYAARLIMDSGAGDDVLREMLFVNSDYTLRRLKEAAGRFTLAALTNDVRLVAECGLRPREQNAALSEDEALRELLIRFIMESRHA